MQKPEREAHHRLLNDMITMAEGAVTAYFQIFGPATTISEVQRNNMADVLSRVIPVYSVSDDRQSIRKLNADDLRGGTFADGGRIITFKDGRSTITGLAVTRTAFKAAIDTMKSQKT